VFDFCSKEVTRNAVAIVSSCGSGLSEDLSGKSAVDLNIDKISFAIYLLPSPSSCCESNTHARVWIKHGLKNFFAQDGFTHMHSAEEQGLKSMLLTKSSIDALLMRFD